MAKGNDPHAAPSTARETKARAADGCVVCGSAPPAGKALVPITVGKRTWRACVFHAMIADRTAPATLAELRRLAEAHDRRRRPERRHGEERRAFWRPTPDRRSERRELGRRREDLLIDALNQG